jgi:adenylate cyclase
MGTGRQLAAIMFTDIVGYTALMQQNEAQARAQIKHYHTALRTVAAAHEGKVLNDYGDGSLCIFPNTTEAVTAAQELQEALKTEPAVPLRIGLHVGELFYEEEKALGDDVNIASRIQSLGQANAVLLSKEVWERIKNHPEFPTVSLGAFHFKNVTHPIEVYALATEGLRVPRRETMEGKLTPSSPLRKSPAVKAAAGMLFVLLLVLSSYWIIKGTHRRAGGVKENSLAVLYFNNLSGDPEQEYFSDGITEEIISRLARIHGLKVKSRTSVAQYKKGTKDTRQIARELGVANILEGSVRKQGNTVRITAQLINAQSDEHIWSEDYDRELHDIFAVQSDIARQIAQKFQVPLTEAARKGLSSNPTDNTDAYDHYLKAQSFTYLSTGLGGRQTNTLRAIGHLRRAIELDPRFADAYALMSENFAYYSYDATQPEQWLDSARLLAQKAVALRPEREQGYLALGRLMTTRGQYEESNQWLFKAHELVPFSAARLIALNFLYQADFARCSEWIQKAKAYDEGELSNYLVPEGWMLYYLGLVDEMKESLDAAKKIKGEAPEVVECAWNYYLAIGNQEEYQRLALKIFAQDEKEYRYHLGVFQLFQRNWVLADSLYVGSSKPDDMDAGLVKLRVGDKKLGVQYLQNAIQRRVRFLGYDDAWHLQDISRCYAALQDNRYLDYFHRSLQKGWHVYGFFQRDPFYDSVRRTPQFKKLEQKMYERNEHFKREMSATGRR